MKYNRRTMKTDYELKEQALKALCLTQDYVGYACLPAIKGWEWYDSGLSLAESIPQSEWAAQFYLRVNKSRANIVDHKSRIITKEEKPLRFEIGKYYRHPWSEDMAILCFAETTAYGKTLIAETAGKHNSGVRCVGYDDDGYAQGWYEITAEDWEGNFD